MGSGPQTPWSTPLQGATLKDKECIKDHTYKDKELIYNL